MQINYVKHNRTAKPEELEKYGKLATHDIESPLLLMYENGEVTDKNGTKIKADKAFIDYTLKQTNKKIRERIKSPFQKMKSYISSSEADIEHIPIIKNHKTDDWDGIVGYSKGLAYTDTVEGSDGQKILSLFIKQRIYKMEGKVDFESTLLRGISPGIRADGSIKEISYVINPCFVEAGAIFSEEAPNEVIPNTDEIQLSEKQLEMMEEITTLEFREKELNDVVIPNHIILSKLIRSGRIAPFQYDSLINSQNTEALELMEKSTFSRDLGLMIGIGKQPVKNQSLEKNVIDQIIDMHKKNDPSFVANSEKEKKIENYTPENDNFISNSASFPEIMNEKLKNILELCEYSPDIAKKYIKVELGEEIKEPDFNDKYLNEFINESKNIKQKLKSLKIELGEPNA